jgi:adenylate cyclase
MRGLTLGRALLVALGAAAVAVGVLMGVLVRRWGDSLLDGAEGVRAAASERAATVVRGALGGAEASLHRVQAASRAGLLRYDDPADVERALRVELLSDPDLAEATFTRARIRDDDGEPFVSGGRSWQVSAWRRPSEAAIAATYRRARPGDDPADHVTFRAALLHHRFSEAPLWSDLHHAEADAALPEPQRRVVVTVQGVVEDHGGRPVGVARLGLLASRLDDVTLVRASAGDGPDPHRVFLADERGRLVTRLHPGQALIDDGGDLRPRAEEAPAEVRAALATPALRETDEEHPRRAARFEADGRTYVLSTFVLPGAQDWRVGVLAPEDHYLGGWRRTRRVLVTGSLLVVVAGAAALGAGLRSVRRSLGALLSTTARMREFDFAPVPVRSPFRDLDQVLRDVEQAKTALRALGRYAPVDLVRELYRAGREPRLGGELREVTVLFTDLEGFTAAAESRPPDELARALGRYFETMTAAVHASGGIVDKYIGDAVMALWNVPSPRSDHAARACAAALAARDAARGLMASPEWGGLPPLRTRFGLHCGDALVGHFGAPDRMSYTALGDAVNLASRLEGQNRAYGTTILASQAVREAAGGAFAFRLVDVVAVKGRRQGVAVHELLGAAGEVSAEGKERARTYEAAFARYRARHFEEARDLFDRLDGDAPARVLAERCRAFLAEPPAAEWSGVHSATQK